MCLYNQLEKEHLCQVPHRCRINLQAGIRPGTERTEQGRIDILSGSRSQLETLPVGNHDGTQYRLVSLYESNHMAVNYVSQDKNQAILFVHGIHPLSKKN